MERGRGNGGGAQGPLAKRRRALFGYLCRGPRVSSYAYTADKVGLRRAGLKPMVTVACSLYVTLA